MADAFFKPSSGDDLVLSNDDASKKIEIPESGDVEVTGDFKTTTLKATNLKANDGTPSISIADSSGNISLNNPITSGTFNGTIGSGATFQNGIIESQTIIKYAFDTNQSYNNQGSTEKVCTRSTDSDTAVYSLNVNAGYTYVYNFIIGFFGILLAP